MAKQELNDRKKELLEIYENSHKETKSFLQKIYEFCDPTHYSDLCDYRVLLDPDKDWTNSLIVAGGKSYQPSEKQITIRPTTGWLTISLEDYVSTLVYTGGMDLYDALLTLSTKEFLLDKDGFKKVLQKYSESFSLQTFVKKYTDDRDFGKEDDFLKDLLKCQDFSIEDTLPYLSSRAISYNFKFLVEECSLDPSELILRINSCDLTDPWVIGSVLTTSASVGLQGIIDAMTEKMQPDEKDEFVSSVNANRSNILGYIQCGIQDRLNELVRNKK